MTLLLQWSTCCTEVLRVRVQLRALWQPRASSTVLCMANDICCLMSG